MDWANFIEGAVAGLAGGYTLKSVINIRRSTSVTQATRDDSMRNVTQRNNTAGGSIAGRDINQPK
jgi:hypothetical protein